MNKLYFKKNIDPVFLELIVECNKKGLITKDCCAGYGPSICFPKDTLVITRRHSCDDIPYVTFSKLESDEKVFKKLSKLLKKHVMFANEEPFFFIDYIKKFVIPSQSGKFVKKIVCGGKYRVQMNTALYIPLMDGCSGVNKIAYRKKLHNIKKKWHKLFYEAVCKI